MIQPNYPLSDFFRSKKIFITGHSGFKGSWLVVWLKLLGGRVYGYALDPPTSPSLFTAVNVASMMEENWVADVREYSTLTSALQQAQPDIVYHFAAQPLVRESYLEPRDTFETNVIGTVNILDAIRKVPSVKVCIVVTSDKCYRNREWEYSYREEDEIGGVDPYSASKACTELVTSAYRTSFLSTERGRAIGLATVRAGNVIGGGDWAKDRIISDCILSLQAGNSIKVRNPQAMRPWQHVLEPLSGYLWLAAKLWSHPEKYSEAWNFGPASDDWHSVREMADMVVSEWGSGDWTDISEAGAPHEAGLLRLSIDKAQSRLGWMPIWRLHKAVCQTINWYKSFYSMATPTQLLMACETAIKEYSNEAHDRGIEWAQ
jgi:CDP-glucose 4,6-dehydratase